MSSELRLQSRKKTFLKGRILFNGGASTMDCIVRDLSEHGARLELTETAILPEVFDLYILHKDATFRSAVRWRHDSSFGISFLNVAPPKATPKSDAETDSTVTALTRRIMDLENENTTLRARLASFENGEAAATASAA